MKKTRLLLVDDESNILKSLARSLEGVNLELALASSGPEALERLEADRFDLVISDQVMPGMTGVEFLSLAQNRHPALISMILTGYADIQVAIRAINDIGVYKFILKPWENHDLLMTVDKAKRLSAMMKSDRLFAQDLMAPSDRMVAAGIRARTGREDSWPGKEKKHSQWKALETRISRIKALDFRAEDLEQVFNGLPLATRKKVKAEVLEFLHDRHYCQLIGVNYANPEQRDMVTLYKFAMDRHRVLPGSGGKEER